MIKARKEYQLGLDIGVSSLKLVQLHYTSKGAELYKAANISIPPNIGKEERAVFVVETIEKLFAQNTFKKSDIFSCLPGSDACVRALNIPLMPADEIPEAVKWSSKKHIAYPLADTVLSYSDFGEVVDQGTRKLSIVFIAAPKNVFDYYSTIIKNSGLKATCLNTTCFSFGNIVAEYGLAKENSVALANIGYSGTDISIFKEGRLVFTRNIPEGGKTFDEAIVEAFSLSEEKEKIDCLKAEELRFRLGFQSSGNANYERAINNHMERIIRELQLSFSHYRQVSRGGQMEKLLISGGMAKMKGIDKVLAEKLSMPVDKLAPPPYFNTASPPVSAEEFGSLAIAYGLSLENGANPNLLLSKTKSLNKNPIFEHKLFKKAVGVFIGINVILFAGLSAIGVFYNNQIKVVNDGIKQLESSSAGFLDLRSEIKRVESKKALYEKIAGDQFPVIEALIGVANAIDPKEISIRQMNIAKSGDKMSLSMEGEVLSAVNNDLAGALGKFVSGLEKTNYLDKITPTTRGSLESGKGTLIFKIECNLKK